MPETRILPIAARGLSTSFSEAETPSDYATAFTNRFVNGSGDAEKREGIESVGVVVSSAPNITGLHEFVNELGTSIKFASGAGAIWRYDVSAWTEVYAFSNKTERIKSIQMEEKLIFFNGEDLNVWTDNGSSFKILRPLVEVGTVASATFNTFIDSEVSSWNLQTDVSENDIVFFPSTNQTALITSISAATITHTRLDRTNFGFAGGTTGSRAGTRYEIYDTIELNIFDTPGGLFKDNIATATSATNNEIKVSGVTDWYSKGLRVNDIIYNTTRGTGSYVINISGATLFTQVVSGQTNGDSLAFLKFATPLIYNAAVHFGRLYAIDSRDRKKLRISGSNNPQDFTTDSASLDLTEFGGTVRGNIYNAGSLNSEGETLKSIVSFQSFLMLGGSKNLFAFQGSQPFGDGADFSPITVLPQGIRSKNSLINLGNDVAWIADSGIQLWSATDAQAIVQKSISESINETLRDIIRATPEDELQLIQYSRRNWLIAKIGSELYIWNFAPITLARNSTRDKIIPSWFKFEGGFSNQFTFRVMQDGDLWTGGSNGVVSRFETGTYDDNGDIYLTDYQTGWNHLDSGRTQNLKSTKFIEPYFETGDEISYEITCEGDWDQTSLDSVIVSALPEGAPIGFFTIGTSKIGGSRIFNPKIPLRARGTAFRWRITTQDNKGPDILGRMAVTFNRMGRP